MKNVKLLTRHVQSKRTTEMAVFFDHNDVFLRLDWEWLDDLDIPQSEVYLLMSKQIGNDIGDTELVDEIKLRQREYPPIPGEAVQKFLDNGFKEQDATELEEILVEKFGEMVE